MLSPPYFGNVVLKWSELQELNNIEEELNSKTYLIGNTENAAATLCEVLGNEVTASEIDAKLQHIKRQHGDLKKRNESLKRGLEKNVKQGLEFDLACDEMSSWLVAVADRIKLDVKVSG